MKKKRDKEFQLLKNEFAKKESEFKDVCFELRKDVYILHEEIKNLQESVDDSEKDYTNFKTDVNLNTKNTNERIAVLSDEIVKLRQDLENYTRINEDAKVLNNSVNLRDEEILLSKAIEEYLASESDDIENAVNLTVLDVEQRKALNAINNTNQNVFITGRAGTGKSFLLKIFAKTNQEKKYILLAPTGIAAINVGGATLHTTFGYNNLVYTGIEELEKGKVQLNSEKRKVLESIDAIIIDEISMVRADTFEKIDRILKSICKNDKLFGGKQIIVLGDMFQLPPIVKDRSEETFLVERFGGKYFFDSDVYKKGNFEFVELTTNHRQQYDEEFFELLNCFREGETTEDVLIKLNGRASFDDDELRRDVIRLFPRKGDAERINNEELNKINEKEYIYDAKTTYKNGTIKENSFPIVYHLKLKVGATVMMVSNDSKKRWVNGTLGIVSDLGRDYIKVTISDAKKQTYEYEVFQQEFEEREAIYKNGKIEYKTAYKVVQYPLVLAYAITIHKSQGMSYNKIACDISRCFESGQAYVALSRCRSLEGLYLLSEVTEDAINVDAHVRDFYHSQKKS